jgi:hypothetical protein
MTAGLLRDALALLVGFVTGVLSALFGIGGAIVSNPGLRILGAAPLVAVGTTLPSILPGAVSGTLRYRREGLIDWRLIIPAAAAGLLAVVGGSLLSHAVPGQGHLLLLLIAVLLAVTAWRTAFTGPPLKPRCPGPGTPASTQPHRRPELGTTASTPPRRRLRSPSGGPGTGGSGCRAPPHPLRDPRHRHLALRVPTPSPRVGRRVGGAGSRPGLA